ncbi:MAG: septum formation initiator family protein [Candidatus Omnitrophota bacterium]
MIIKKATWLFTIAFIVLIIFLPGYSRLQDLRQKNRDLENRIDELQQENLTLKEKQELLENDPYYLEKVAREKMGVAREGEIIYRIEE